MTFLDPVGSLVSTLWVGCWLLVTLFLNVRLKSVILSVGVLECCNDGVLECWECCNDGLFGVLECCNDGLFGWLECWSVGVLECESVRLEECRIGRV